MKWRIEMDGLMIPISRFCVHLVRMGNSTVEIIMEWSFAEWTESKYSKLQRACSHLRMLVGQDLGRHKERWDYLRWAVQSSSILHWCQSNSTRYRCPVACGEPLLLISNNAKHCFSQICSTNSSKVFSILWGREDFWKPLSSSRLNGSASALIKFIAERDRFKSPLNIQNIHSDW